MRITYSLLLGASMLVGVAVAETPTMAIPPGARLAFEEDWSSGRIDPKKWYKLHRRWGRDNNGVVRPNVFVARDSVDGQQRHVLVCRGHGDQYKGPVAGWKGNSTRVGGVIVSKAFFASGKFEIVMKIGDAEPSSGGPTDPARPIGMVPAIWTYSCRWPKAGKAGAASFSPDSPMYNPHLNHRGWGSNEYWSELDFPEFGRHQDLETGLYNTFLNRFHVCKTFPTKAAIDGRYHTFTTLWRTHLVPLDGVTDEQVIEYDGYWWVQDKAIPFESYRGNPLKRLGKDSYALYAGKEATHFIDGEFVGRNEKYTPCLAAQLNIGVWFPGWGGVAPWAESSISIASVKVWQFDDPGDVRGILVDDIGDNIAD